MLNLFFADTEGISFRSGANGMSWRGNTKEVQRIQKEVNLFFNYFHRISNSRNILQAHNCGAEETALAHAEPPRYTGCSLNIALTSDVSFQLMMTELKNTCQEHVNKYAITLKGTSYFILYTMERPTFYLAGTVGRNITLYHQIPRTSLTYQFQGWERDTIISRNVPLNHFQERYNL